MPQKKLVKTATERTITKRKTKTTLKTEESMQTVEVAPVVTVSDVITSATPQLDQTEKKKSVRKAGRTLLVHSLNNGIINDKAFEDLAGLVSRTETKSTRSYFLVFDTIENAVSSFRKLRQDFNDLKVKFSYYRVFFKIEGLTNETDYSKAKIELNDYVSQRSGASVLYCKLYNKNGSFIGSGDLTVDTLEGMNALINRENSGNTFTFGGYSGTFYRFNTKKGQFQQVQQN